MRQTQNHHDRPISDVALNRILEVIGASWADSTKELYGTGLLVFHVYCDLNGIPEPERCPVPRARFIAFLATLAGSYSGAAISNYAAAVRAWHLLHGFAWKINQDELKLTLQGASRLAPRSSKRPKRPPLTFPDLKVLCDNLDRDDPGDAAILACITTVFYCVARLGEFTVPAIAKFSQSEHITRSNLSFANDPEGRPIIQFFIPFTKCNKEKGENTQCAPHPGCITDPEAALRNHLRINQVPVHAHLFTWKHPKTGLRPLSKSQVISRITAIAKQHGLPDIKGHSLRIGGTLHYLLKGIPFEVVKVIGRWAGDTFTGYLREHALILAPYLQTDPEIFEAFRRIAMPPIR